MSRINSILDQELGFRVGRTYRSIEAEFAGQQAQLDHSRSKYFQLKEHNGDRDDWLLVVQAETANATAKRKRRHPRFIVQPGCLPLLTSSRNTP